MRRVPVSGFSSNYQPFSRVLREQSIMVPVLERLSKPYHAQTVLPTISHHSLITSLSDNNIYKNTFMQGWANKQRQRNEELFGYILAKHSLIKYKTENNVRIQCEIGCRWQAILMCCEYKRCIGPCAILEKEQIVNGKVHMRS